MDKSNLELFKQALSEGVSNRFDKMAAECTEEIVCSDKHNLAMRAIVYGKVKKKSSLSSGKMRFIAILIAIALALTGCGIIFRTQICELFENLFVTVTYDEGNSRGGKIENIYQLSYVPEGYELKNEMITPLCTQYEFQNQNGDYIWFEQKLVGGTDFVVDSEEGYSQIEEVIDYEVYYRYTNKNHLYVWKDSKYSMSLKSTLKLSTEEILAILNGITEK